MNFEVIFLLAVIVILILALIGKNIKKRWYKVYLANNKVRLLHRTFAESWSSTEKYLRFRDDYGHIVTFPAAAHWILMWEEVYPNELDTVRTEIEIENRNQEVEGIE